MLPLTKLIRYIKSIKDHENLSVYLTNQYSNHNDYNLWNICTLNKVNIGITAAYYGDKICSYVSIILFLNGVLYRFKCQIGWKLLFVSYSVYKNNKRIFEYHDNWDHENIDKVHPLYVLTKYMLEY